MGHSPHRQTHLKHFKNVTRNYLFFLFSFHLSSIIHSRSNLKSWNNLMMKIKKFVSGNNLKDSREKFNKVAMSCYQINRRCFQLSRIGRRGIRKDGSITRGLSSATTLLLHNILKLHLIYGWKLININNEIKAQIWTFVLPFSFSGWQLSLMECTRAIASAENGWQR